MLWTAKNKYQFYPFELESELESAILEVVDDLFGEHRIYLDVKRKIGGKGKTNNIPDGYLIDLSSIKEPKLYIVENELAKHDPLKHIAVQILEFSLSFETSPQKVKSIVKGALSDDKKAQQQCQKYAFDNGYENIDYLLEKIIYGKDAFNALVIIDEMPDELENVLISKFRFPVEILTLQRFSSQDKETVYLFDPFLSDVSSTNLNINEGAKSTIDLSEIDTIVVPAREEGFQEVFLGEDCWYAIRMHSSMIPKIKYIAAYQVAPESAITHIASVESIKQWKDTNKYILKFSEPAKAIGPIKLVPKGKVKPPYSSRYTSYAKLQNAKNLDDAF